MKFFLSAFSLYFFVLPFQLALSPWEGVDLASIRLITAGLVATWFVYGLLYRQIVFPSLVAMFFLSGFMMLCVGSALWSENYIFALRKALFLLSFLPMFLVLSALFWNNPQSRIRVLKLYVMGTVLASCVGIALFLLQFVIGLDAVFDLLVNQILPWFLGPAFARAVAEYPSLLVNISGLTLLRASGVFPDPHMFSLYLGMATPLSLWFYIEASFSRKKMAWLSAFLLLVTGVLLSFSRGAYVALLCGAGFFFWGSLLIRGASVWKRWLTVLFVMLVLGAVAASPVGDRFVSSFSQEDGSNKERVRLWKEAAAHIAERPMFGVGLGNYPLLVKPSAGYRDPIYAHNVFLDLGVEIGLVGLFFFLALAGYALVGVWTCWHSGSHWQSLSVATSFLVFFSHACFEMPLFSVHILPVFVLLLAVGVSYRYEKHTF